MGIDHTFSFHLYLYFSAVVSADVAGSLLAKTQIGLSNQQDVEEWDCNEA